MRFINKETELELVIDQKLVERLGAYGKNKYPDEFGGLLLGRYINNNKTVLIEDTVLPTKYKSSRYYFERGTAGLKESLELHFNAKPSLVYVGEWHTHPDNPATPSQLDLKSMRELADDEKVLIKNPVLLILEISKHTHFMNIYFLHNNNLLRYEQQ